MSPEWIRFFGTLAGGIVAGGVALLIRFLSGRHDAKRILGDRLEKAILLSQTIYDAHLARIDWLKSLDRPRANDWFQAPPHPGAEMNELKMIVGIYAETVTPKLVQYYSGHATLKKVFTEIREGAPEFSRWGNLGAELKREVEQGFADLEAGTAVLKDELSEILRVKVSL
jgi:hypothetical protein